MIASLQAGSRETQRLIYNVVSPYVDGVRAKLDALRETQELLSLFLTRLNAFFRNKSVLYNLSDGLIFSTPQGTALEPSRLSSGERQLLLLLTQVVTARNAATVFLIDEPELSLNVKWQRTLIETLLDLVRGTSVQFILATHSLELLATHRDQVYRLPTTADNA